MERNNSGDDSKVLEWNFPKFCGASNRKLILELDLSGDPWKKEQIPVRESHGGGKKTFGAG